MPGPLSCTAITSHSPSTVTDTRTGEPPCLSALPIRLARITSRRRGSRRTTMPRSASSSTASSQARASMQAVTWSATFTSSSTSLAVPASKRVTSIRFSTRSLRRRVSLTTSATAGAIIGSRSSTSSSSTSATAVSAVSGVRSSCDMSATKRRLDSSRALMSATFFSSASAVLLKVCDRSASSSVPDTSRRWSSSPSPSRRAASPSRCTGLSTVRAAACASRAEPSSARPVAMVSDQPSAFRSSRSWARDLYM